MLILSFFLPKKGGKIDKRSFDKIEEQSWLPTFVQSGGAGLSCHANELVHGFLFEQF